MDRVANLFRKIHFLFLDSHDGFLFLTSVVVTMILVILNRYWKKRSHTSTNDGLLLSLPPGPWKLPFIGNLHQLASAAGSLPHHFLTALAKKYGTMMHLKLGQVSMIVISTPDLAKQVLKIHDPTLSNRPTLLGFEVMSYNSSGIIFAHCNAYWTEMRKICVLELLSAKRVQSFASLREKETWRLVQSITNLSRQTLGPVDQDHSMPSIINLSEMIFSTVNNITAQAALGKRCKHQQEFTSLVHETIRLCTGFGVEDLFPSLKFLQHITRTKSSLEKIHRKMDKILVDIINDHKLALISRGAIEEDRDLVDVLLQLQESGELQFELTANHIKAVTLDIYVAGSDTSASTLEWAMSELLKNPRVMEKAQAEVRQLIARTGKKKINEADINKLEYLKLVIKETLRLHPVGPLIPRQANEKCKVGGYDIPVGAKVLVNAWAIGRDPKYWGANAECFEPERFQGSSIDFRGTNFEFIPFGAGKRMCPGILFGTAAMELVLFHLLYFFNWKLPNDTRSEELDMTETIGLVTRRRTMLNVIAIPFIM